MTLRSYSVTVKPTMKVHSGTWSNGEYTVEVYARDSSHAIRKAREEYKDNGGKGIPAVFRAKLVDTAK